MQNVSLNGIWKLFIAQNKDVKEKSQNFTCAKELLNDGLTAIEGSVPGNFELDLQKATGDTTDYFAYDNVLKLQELENRHLWYATEFDCDAKSDVYLKFEGIDTYSDIYLNGEKLGSTENMLIPYEFCCDRLIKEHNELLVHIYPTEIKAREFPLNSEASAQRYTISGLATRKAASTYGWDICPVPFRADFGAMFR
ncbi:MAG: hypothetical protein KBS41_05600 [Oscillospiraceae bacterium]|nr:hypothetical protein [Candidatus Equicaccousia limihippi]